MRAHQGASVTNDGQGDRRKAAVRLIHNVRRRPRGTGGGPAGATRTIWPVKRRNRPRPAQGELLGPGHLFAVGRNVGLTGSLTHSQVILGGFVPAQGTLEFPRGLVVAPDRPVRACER